MEKRFAALLAGVVFGFGLALSQMVNPAKVLAFLDITGNWDPSLAFVLFGAVLVSLISFRFILKLPRPVFEGTFALSSLRTIDRRLVLGAVLFGVGWGLVGFCPGPAIAALAYGAPKAVLFLVALVAGIAIARRLPAGKPSS